MPFTLQQAMLCVRYISCLTIDTGETQRCRSMPTCYPHSSTSRLM
jgi:hypothetical protein